MADLRVAKKYANTYRSFWWLDCALQSSYFTLFSQLSVRNSVYALCVLHVSLRIKIVHALKLLESQPNLIFHTDSRNLRFQQFAFFSCGRMTTKADESKNPSAREWLDVWKVRETRWRTIKWNWENKRIWSKIFLKQFVQNNSTVSVQLQRKTFIQVFKRITLLL